MPQILLHFPLQGQVRPRGQRQRDLQGGGSGHWELELGVCHREVGQQGDGGVWNGIDPKDSSRGTQSHQCHVSLIGYFGIAQREG